MTCRLLWSVFSFASPGGSIGSTVSGQADALEEAGNEFCATAQSGRLNVAVGSRTAAPVSQRRAQSSSRSDTLIRKQQATTEQTFGGYAVPTANNDFRSRLCATTGRLLGYAVQAPNVTSTMRHQVDDHDRVDQVVIDKKIEMVLDKWPIPCGQSSR